MSDNPCILSSETGGARTLTLNRPEARNALSLGMLQALAIELDRAAADPMVRVVVLKGAGPAFCAGHDLKEMRDARFGGDYAASLFAECAKVMLTILRLPKPVVAQVHGVATAAGCQLVATCDLALAAEDARFATPGVNIGLFCSTPMVALSRNVGRKAAMHMLLTGELIDAHAAVRIGLINEAVPAAELAHRSAALAAAIAAKSPAVLAIGKEAFYRQAELPIADAYAYTAQVMAANLTKPDAREGIGAFLDKRIPVWSGQ